MTKRVISLLLALALLLPMLPRLTAGAKAAGNEDLRQTIAAQYDAYAASIAQPGADEGAIRQMLNHSIDHPGKTW